MMREESQTRHRAQGVRSGDENIVAFVISFAGKSDHEFFSYLKTTPEWNGMYGKRAKLLSCNELFIYLRKDRKCDENDTQCINC